MEEFGTVTDVVPTMLELAGVTHPALNGSKGLFQGRMVERMRGVSWVKWLHGHVVMTVSAPKTIIPTISPKIHRTVIVVGHTLRASLWDSLVRGNFGT